MKGQTIRHWIVLVAMLLVAFSVSARVVYVHVHQNDELKREGERHYKRNIPLYSYRGSILDSRGRELAVSAPSVSIWADPSDLLSDLKSVAGLSEKIGVDFFALKRRIERSQNRDFMYVKRQVSPEVINIVQEHGLEAVSFINERKRVYPEGSVFSHVVGITDVDGNGVEGVELLFDSHLKGKDGIKSVIRDRLGRSFEIVDVPRKKEDGKNVTLSIDRNIQYIAYSELRRALSDHDATSGMLVVLDVKQGKVLSLVNYPAYNPNERKGIRSGLVRNRAVTDVFEPGSAIKPFIVAAALEEGTVNEQDVFDVSPGYIEISGKKVKDSKNYHRLDVSGVLSKSSNVGIVQVASRINNQFLSDKLRDYGLFSSSGIELPGEITPLFRSHNEWGEAYKEYLSFGYGAELAALQLANAYMVIANDGVRRDVSVLDGEARSPGVRVMSEEVARSTRRMLKQVVAKGGTGTRADTGAYQVSGKTGTAKKIKDGLYVDDSYIAVFCGIAPADDPAIVAVVIVDDPRKNGFYGGQVAAPVFSRVASRVLRYMDVLPDKKIASSVGRQAG